MRQGGNRTAGMCVCVPAVPGVSGSRVLRDGEVLQAGIRASLRCRMWWTDTVPDCRTKPPGSRLRTALFLPAKPSGEGSCTSGPCRHCRPVRSSPGLTLLSGRYAPEERHFRGRTPAASSSIPLPAGGRRRGHGVSDADAPSGSGGTSSATGIPGHG